MEKRFPFRFADLDYQEIFGVTILIDVWLLLLAVDGG